MSQFFTSLTKDELRDMFREEFNKALQKEGNSDNITKNKDEFLTIDEVCKLLRISKPTLYKRIEDGTINKIGFGSKVLFVKSDIISRLKAKEGQNG